MLQEVHVLCRVKLHVAGGTRPCRATTCCKKYTPFVGLYYMLQEVHVLCRTILHVAEGTRPL